MKHCLYLFLFMAGTMLWKEEERSRIRAVQMDNFIGMLGINPKCMDRGVVWSEEGAR